MLLMGVLTYSKLCCDVVTHDPLGSHEVILGCELTLIIQRTLFCMLHWVHETHHTEITIIGKLMSQREDVAKSCVFRFMS